MSFSMTALVGGAVIVHLPCIHQSLHPAKLQGFLPKANQKAKTQALLPAHWHVGQIRPAGFFFAQIAVLLS
jgi:hypothetical protein